MRAKPKRSVKGIPGVLGRRTLRVSSSREHKDLEEKTSIEQEVKLEIIQLGLCVYILQVVNTTKRAES